MLLPASLQDWLTEGYLTWFISNTKANASRNKAMSYERMQQAEAELKVQIDALLERAKSTDEVEADEPDLDIPAEIARRATP